MLQDYNASNVVDGCTQNVRVSHSSCSQPSETDAVEWKCSACVTSKRLSIIAPEPEEDNDDIWQQPECGEVITEKILQDIRSQVCTIIKNELERTLKFYSDKVDDYEKKSKLQDEKIKLLEQKCNSLQNKNTNLDIKFEALQQRLNEQEHNQLANHLEIVGLGTQDADKKSLQEKVSALAELLKVPVTDVISMRRGIVRGNRTSPVVLTMCEGSRDTWIQAARNFKPTSKHLGGAGDEKVILRQCLTPYAKRLLWLSKDKLKNVYKYIWCNQGKVLLRKEEGDRKIEVIRSETDIQRFLQD